MIAFTTTWSEQDTSTPDFIYIDAMNVHVDLFTVAEPGIWMQTKDRDSLRCQ